MRFDNVSQSVLKPNEYQLQAAELLVHLLQYQTVASVGGSGAHAATFCADFITTLAERLRAMPNKQ